jgi:ABC-type glycerol-3-phosphate transport system substrate-binding protein
LVIVATDKDRQNASAELVESLLQPEANGKWTRITDRLPTTRRALATWDQDEPYTSFLGDLLEVARPHPRGIGYDLVAKTLQRSLRDVLRGTVSPREAASEAVDAVEQ